MGSSKLFRHLSEHVASAHCDDACSATYVELIHGVLRMNDADLFFIGNYGLQALRVVIYERCVVPVAQVCRVLATLLSGTPNQISLFVHYDLLSPLVILLADSDPQVRSEARAALCNFFARANFGHWYQAVKLGFVESLLIPLMSQTAAVVYEAVDVCFALMVSAKNAEIDCYILQSMLNNEVHSIFAGILLHDDKRVASTSRKFFDKYFREEFVEEDVEQESSF